MPGSSYHGEMVERKWIFLEGCRDPGATINEIMELLREEGYTCKVLETVEELAEAIGYKPEVAVPEDYAVCKKPG